MAHINTVRKQNGELMDQIERMIVEYDKLKQENAKLRKDNFIPWYDIPRPQKPIAPTSNTRTYRT